MSDQIRIEALIPTPMPDGRRVQVTLRTAGLPPYSFGMVTPGVTSSVEDLARPAPSQDDRPSGPYPDVDLSIYDQRGNEVAATFIVEHKEPDLDFTLHLRDAEPGGTYTVRATLTGGGQVIQVVETPFEFR